MVVLPSEGGEAGRAAALASRPSKDGNSLSNVAWGEEMREAPHGEGMSHGLLGIHGHTGGGSENTEAKPVWRKRRTPNQAAHACMSCNLGAPCRSRAGSPRQQSARLCGAGAANHPHGPCQAVAGATARGHGLAGGRLEHRPPLTHATHESCARSSRQRTCWQLQGAHGPLLPTPWGRPRSGCSLTRMCCHAASKSGLLKAGARAPRCRGQSLLCARSCCWPRRWRNPLAATPPKRCCEPALQLQVAFHHAVCFGRR